MNILNCIKKQYKAEGGYLEFLKIAFPLLLTMCTFAIQLFIDRVFLARYSQGAYAACIPAGALFLSIQCLFSCTVAYVDIFVAQYYGKKEYRSIGPAVWQSVYLAGIAALIILVVSFFTEQIFINIGHSGVIVVEEIKYFKMLCYGAFPAIAYSALFAFYSGRGNSKVVLFIDVLGAITNIVLDYCLIFGNWGFPEKGITGAALATGISFFVMCLGYVFLIISRKNNNIYNTRCFKPNFVFMKKLLRYGFPNGLVYFFEIAQFGIFMLIIARIGVSELIAGNILCTMYNLIYTPCLGFCMATSIMVGIYLGKNKASIAQISVKSSIHVVYTYMIVTVLVLNLFPNLFASVFLGSAQVAMTNEVRHIFMNLLKIATLFFMIDPMYVVFSSAIRGAGDTAFVMKKLMFSMIFLTIAPAYLTVIVFKLSNIYIVWTACNFSTVFLACSCYFRYRSNKWKNMRVIEMNIVDG
ncbi:MAG: MATE family efflux transporter [Endomicrobium sp.]|jgi:MATE family multidrug resistance protein|nr:MATE family efflux transporter [Endomicrobium sp.]